jgi:hypothetical protein
MMLDHKRREMQGIHSWRPGHYIDVVHLMAPFRHDGCPVTYCGRVYESYRMFGGPAPESDPRCPVCVANFETAESLGYEPRSYLDFHFLERGEHPRWWHEQQIELTRRRELLDAIAKYESEGGKVVYYGRR